MRAQQRPASLERAAPDFAAEMLAVVRGPPLAPAPTFDAPMFDSPLQSAANTANSTASIGGKVAAAFSAAASFFSTTPRSFRCCCCCRGSLRGGVGL